MIVRDEKWRILVQDHVKLDFFTIPIWKVKASENIENVMKQELQEELWIQVIRYEKMGECEGEYDYEWTKVRIKTHIFDILSYEGIPQNKESKKHRSIQFMSISDIRQLPKVSDATRYIMQEIL